MKIDRGLMLALGAAALTAAACAPPAATGTTGAPRGGAASLPQVTCSSGAPTATTYATAAQNALNRTLIVQGDARTPFFQQALEQARQGIATAADNPLHYFLAGQAYAGLGDLAGADSSFDRAVQICPEFASEVDPARLEAFARTFQSGLEAYNAGDTARAIASWESAGQFYDKLPDPYYNLAVVYGQRGDLQRAVQNYTRALQVMETAPADSSTADTRANIMTGLLSAGAQLFQQNQFGPSGEVFATIARIDPNNRDAWYNHALALYKLEQWQALIPVATRLVQIDPLNYNGQIILFNAYKGVSEAAKARNDAATERTNRERALSTLQTADALPVHVDAVQITNQEGGAKVSGSVTGAAARAGTPVQLEFTLFGPAGRLGTGTVTVSAPAKDQKTTFELTVPGATAVTSYSYRLVR